MADGLCSITSSQLTWKKRWGYWIQMWVRLRIPAKTFDNSKDQRSTFFSWILRVSSLFEKLCEEVGGKALIIALHSYKGGTGKTLLSVNLATIFAKMGKKVCLLDLDLRAPSIHSFFRNGSNYWVNDYLSKACKIEKVLVDCTTMDMAKARAVCWFGKPFNRSHSWDDG